MDNFSSSSGDMSDSQGFNDFMNASESSSEYMPVPKSFKKPGGRPNTGDPYAYDIDFGNIKVPSKNDPPKKPPPKKVVARPKTPEEDSSIDIRPKTTGSKFKELQNEYKKALKNVKLDSSEDFNSESSSKNARPQQKHWKDARKDYLGSSSDDLSDSNDRFNIKTEPFKAKVNQPISLTKKLEVPKEPVKEIKGFFQDPKKGKIKLESSSSSINSSFLNTSERGSEDDMYEESSSRKIDKESESYMRRNEVSGKGEYSNQDPEDSEEQDESYEVESSLVQSGIPQKVDKVYEKYSDTYSGKQTSEKNSEKISEPGSEIYTDRQSAHYTENYSENFEEYESHKFPDNFQPVPGRPVDSRREESDARPGKVGEKIFKINEVDETQEENNRVSTPGVQAKGRPPAARPQTTNERLLTRERELEIELVDLRKTVNDLENELKLKVEEIYYYEKKEKQANFNKIEYEALEKVKTQLREAYHKIELYKIETEELIKQVDYTEARVKDLEAENAALKTDLSRKDKIADERMKLTESRTADRMIKELTRQFEVEKEDFLRVKKEMEIELSTIKADFVKIEGENRDLRTRIWSIRDQEEKYKDLQQENYLLSQKLSGEVISEKPKESINEALQKEIMSQELLLKGYQKENEKLMGEIRNLKAQIKEQQLRIHSENKKVDLLKSNLIKDHGGVLIKENISDLESINELAGGTVINKEDYLNLKDNLIRLSRELIEKEKRFREKELDLCEQLERLKKYKFEAEFTINTLQNSQEIVNKKAITEVFELEKKEIAERYEKEIRELRGRLELGGNEFKTEELRRIKFLEDHCKGLEEALKLKEPISTLIKAVKPESSEQVSILLRKNSELESKLSELQSKLSDKNLKSSTNFPRADLKGKKKSTAQSTKPPSDAALVDRIKELEKQLEDNKNYYLSKLNSQRPDSTEELKDLRAQLLNYEKILSNLQSSSSPVQPALYSFLGSFTGSVWCQICQESSQLYPNICQKNSKELNLILSRIIEILESHSASPSFSSYAAFDKILDKTMQLSSLFKGITNWNQVEKVYNELCGIINVELNVACQGVQEGVSEKEEEYWSDFSDCDQEQEEIEIQESVKVINKIKDGIGYLNRIGGGWLSLVQIQEILCMNIPELSTISVQSLLRKLKAESGKINIDQFLIDLKANSLKWWEQRLKDSLWEARSQISSKGNHQGLVDRQAVPWILECILDKIENYVTREGIDCEMLTEQLFSGAISISKRNFRKKVLEHKLPLTREECHIIMKELDRAKLGQLNAKVFLAFTKKSPKVAWAPQKPEEIPEFKQLSERDAQFMLVQANKRIRELEEIINASDYKKPVLGTDYTLALRLKTAEDELESAKAKLGYCVNENERLRIDKQRLEAHVSKQPASVGASEFLALQRKLEAIEENHYRREQEMKNRMNGISFRNEQELEEVKRKYESEKMALQKVIIKKNEEINEFKVELEELLNEIELLRSKRRSQH